MKNETVHKLSEFNISSDEEFVLSERYKAFEDYLQHKVYWNG